MREQPLDRPPLLVAEGLSKDYRSTGRRFAGRSAHAGRPALSDASLAVARGAVLGVVGESGSGKSTLARCVSLLERPDSGRVLLDGLDLTALGPRQLRRERRRIQVVFQDPYASLNPRLSVGSALAEVLRVHRLVPATGVPARIAELLTVVGLPSSAAQRHPAEFSGGQRQRICIARALAAAPDLLIADEPLSSLDVSIQAQILNLLLDLRDELSLAMIFVSHDLHVVRRIGETIAVMFGGRIVEVLPPGVALEDARHPYTRALLEALPRLRTKLPDGGRAESGAALPIEGCPFRDRCPHAYSPCTSIDPPLADFRGQHSVACHYVLDAARSSDAARSIAQAE
jgi:oligopeptide/dipeptide ABC transporter ATP-binding protein